MRIVWVPELNPPGRLAISRAPGSTREADLATGLAQIHQAGVQHVLCLLEDDEFAFFHHDHTAQTYAAAIDAAGLTLHRAPIEDYTAPAVEQLRALVSWIRHNLDRSASILVHCMAGRGRAGTVTAGVLIAQGMRPEEAIQLIRWVRPGAIQSAAQEARLLGFTPS